MSFKPCHKNYDCNFEFIYFNLLILIYHIYLIVINCIFTNLIFSASTFLERVFHKLWCGIYRGLVYKWLLTYMALFWQKYVILTELNIFNHDIFNSAYAQYYSSIELVFIFNGSYCLISLCYNLIFNNSK